MKKKVILGLVLVSMLFLISGCSDSPPDLNEMKEDLIGKSIEDVRENFFFKQAITEIPITKDNLKKLKIIKRQTNEENTNDKVFTEITLAQDGVKVIGEVNLIYNRYNEGWMLDEVNEVPNSFAYKPVSAPKKDIVKDSLVNTEVKVFDHGAWRIKENEIKNIEIVDRSTNLENKKDNVIVQLDLKNQLAEAHGKLKLFYSFKPGWKLSKVRTEDKFDYSLTDQANLEERLAKDLIGEKFSWKLFHNWTIMKGEIKKLRVYKKQIRSNGKYRTLFTDIKLASSKRKIEGKLKVDYIYSSGSWKIDNVKSLEDFEISYIPQSKEEIKERFLGDSVTINEKEWQVNEETIFEFKIIDRNIKGGIEKVKIYLKLKSDNSYLEGEVKHLYEFEDNWKLEDIEIIDEFKETKK